MGGEAATGFVVCSVTAAGASGAGEASEDAAGAAGEVGRDAPADDAPVKKGSS